MLNVLLAALSASAEAQTRDWERIEGQRSGFGIKTAIVIRSAEEWRAVWTRHCADRAAPIPPVDFAKEVVVAVFLGSRPTAGYKVELELERDARAASRVVVRYREVRPAGGGFSAEVFSQPFVMRRIPAKDVTLLELGALAGPAAERDPRLQDLAGGWALRPADAAPFDGSLPRK